MIEDEFSCVCLFFTFIVGYVILIALCLACCPLVYTLVRVADIGNIGAQNVLAGSCPVSSTDLPVSMLLICPQSG